MDKATHLNFLNVGNDLRTGRVRGQAGQSVLQGRVPSNWYPRNPPIATAATPQASDINALLDSLSPLVAYLTIQQSVALALAYRTVQPGVISGGTFTVGGVVSAAANSFFDANINVSEPVAVDVVNKNPTLAYDLALRLATQAAIQIDTLFFALYASFTNASVGTGNTPPTAANFATAIGELPNTGEPIFALVRSLSVATIFSSGIPLTGQKTFYNGTAPIVGVGATRPMHLIATDEVAVTASTTRHNLLVLPSAFGYGSADLGSVTGVAPAITPSGTLFIRPSIYRDPEFGTPQLAMQLVVGNTGTGVQTIYVNVLGAPVVLDVTKGVQVLS
jgi:hypothetical protein